MSIGDYLVIGITCRDRYEDGGCDCERETVDCEPLGDKLKISEDYCLVVLVPWEEDEESSLTFGDLKRYVPQWLQADFNDNYSEFERFCRVRQLIFGKNWQKARDLLKFIKPQNLNKDSWFMSATASSAFRNLARAASVCEETEFGSDYVVGLIKVALSSVIAHKTLEEARNMFMAAIEPGSYDDAFRWFAADFGRQYWVTREAENRRDEEMPLDMAYLVKGGMLSQAEYVWEEVVKTLEGSIEDE